MVLNDVQAPIPFVENPSEADLVAACAAGSHEAWRALHRTYAPVAAAFLRKMGVAEGDLDDASQSAFLQVFRYLPTFRGQASFTTWLYRVCLSEARDLRRRNRLADVARAVLRAAWPAGEATTGLELCERLALDRVQAALAQLKPHDRAVFVLYEMEGLDGQQIAEILECPVATVWRRLHYGRAAFKRALGVDETPARRPR
jgi:RNA polymerase sigma-70 factor (ECF subfamily)